MAAQDLEGFQTGKDWQSSQDWDDHSKVICHFKMVEGHCNECRRVTRRRYCRHARRQEGIFTPRRPTQLGRAPQRVGWVAQCPRPVIDRHYCSAGNNDQNHKALVLFTNAVYASACGVIGQHIGLEDVV